MLKIICIGILFSLSSCSSLKQALRVDNNLRAPANVDEFPAQMNCSEDSNILTISTKSGKWYAWNSNHFVNSQGKTVVSPIEVTVSPNALRGQYLVSAVERGLMIATSSPQNNGDIPFTEMHIMLSRDYKASPALGRFTYERSYITYACCEHGMTPPERGQGYCK